MAKFDLYPNPDTPGYLLDVQSDLLDGLNTRMVVPLIPQDIAPKPAARLNPVFTVEGAPHVMATQFMAAVPASLLRTPVANQKDEFARITEAIDMLIQGF